MPAAPPGGPAARLGRRRLRPRRPRPRSDRPGDGGQSRRAARPKGARGAGRHLGAPAGAADPRPLRRHADALLLKLRLQAARNHLLYGDMPIQDIAAACGFSSPSVLSRTFRAHFGLTPRAFRSEFSGDRLRRLPARDPPAPEPLTVRRREVRAAQESGLGVTQFTGPDAPWPYTALKQNVPRGDRRSG